MASDMSERDCCEMIVTTPDGYRETMRFDSFASMKREGRILNKKGYQILYWFCDMEEFAHLWQVT